MNWYETCRLNDPAIKTAFEALLATVDAIAQMNLAPSARSNPTAFQAVSLEPPDPLRMEGWRSIGIARTRSSI